MTRFSIRIAAVNATLLMAGATMSQHSDHASHAVHAPGTMVTGTMVSGTPTEPGQDAFAAIAEIVALLSDDPETDWRRVDIDALRSHLVDMNALVLGAEVEATPRADGLSLRVSLTGRAGEAAARMVPAHGPVLAAATGWESDVQVDGDTILWSVTDPSGANTARIRALGFFGLMATGDHHRAHHMAMARGSPAH